MAALFLAIVLLWFAIFCVVVALCQAAHNGDIRASQLRGFEASQLKERDAAVLHVRVR